MESVLRGIEINFESLATGQRAAFDSRDADPDLVRLFSDVLQRGRLSVTEPDLDLVVERLHDPEDPGSVLQGALLYLFQNRPSQEIVCGSLICWESGISEDAWHFAQSLQRASNVVCCGGQGEPPSLPWSAGLMTKSFAGMELPDRERIASWERAITTAVLNTFHSNDAPSHGSNNIQ